MDADTQAINNASEVVQQPPLVFQGENKPLELVFLCDYTGSMVNTRTDLINNINTFAANLDAKVTAGTIPSWKARVIVFGDWNSYYNNNFVRATSDFTNPASSDPNQIKTQAEAFTFPMGPGIIVPGQNSLDESPIDAIGYAVNNTTWSPDSNKGMILFTDHGSQPPNGSFGSSLDIANAVKNQGVNLFIYGDDDTVAYPNEELMTFVGQSEANFSDFANSANMSSTLNDFIQSVLGPEEIIDFDTLAQYIALNGAKQNRIRNLIDSNALLKNHATESLGEIRDLDVAAESVNFSRLKLLQDAGTAYIAQSNVAMNSSLFNLIL
jgi:flagellin-like hook-associated protein FlgL